VSFTVSATDGVCAATKGYSITTNRILGLDSDAISGFALYPNPAKGGVVFVETPNAGDAIIRIFNTLGVMVYATNGAGTVKLNIADLAAGIYIAELQTNGKILRTSFVK
jgi:Secretion system C-terminal sorting domain